MGDLKVTALGLLGIPCFEGPCPKHFSAAWYHLSCNSFKVKSEDYGAMMMERLFS